MEIKAETIMILVMQQIFMNQKGINFVFEVDKDSPCHRWLKLFLTWTFHYVAGNLWEKYSVYAVS